MGGVISGVVPPINTTQLFSLLVGIITLSVLPFRSRLYELFIKLHHTCALGVLVLLWLHTPPRRNLSTGCLAVACSILALQQSLWTFKVLRKNGIFSHKYECDIECLDSSPGTSGATRIIIRNGSWKFLPGQYIYIRMRNLYPQHWCGYLETHPYVIAWTHDDETGRSQQLELVVENRGGFSESLNIAVPRMNSRPVTRHVIVDGPYGNVSVLESHDVVVFTASGIGLVAHLLPIKSLLQASSRTESRTRRIYLAWVLDAEGKYFPSSKHNPNAMASPRNLVPWLYSRDSCDGSYLYARCDDLLRGKR